MRYTIARACCFVLTCWLSSCYAQAEPYRAIDNENKISAIFQRADGADLMATRFNPTINMPQSELAEAWYYGYCKNAIGDNIFFTIRDFCMSLVDGWEHGWRYQEMIEEGVPPRMPPAPEPFPSLDDPGTDCSLGWHFHSPVYLLLPPFYRIPCRAPAAFRQYPVLTDEQRAESEAYLRNFSEYIVGEVDSGIQEDLFHLLAPRRYNEIEHFRNLLNVKFWEVPTRVAAPRCSECLFPRSRIEQDPLGLVARVVTVKRAFVQPENDQVAFIFYVTIDRFNTGGRTVERTMEHRVFRYGAPVSIWARADVIASAYADRILQSWGEVSSEPFLVQLYRATMYGDTYLKWYDKSQGTESWLPDLEIAKDLFIDTLSYFALIGSFGTGLVGRLALAIDAGFLVYETYDFICHPSWQTSLKAGLRLLGVAGAAYAQFLRRKLPARSSDVAGHIAPANRIQTACKEADYAEFYANQVNTAIYNIRGGMYVDEAAEGFRRMMAETQLSRVNVVDDAVHTGGAWAAESAGAERVLYLEAERFARHPRLRETLREIQDSIITHGVPDGEQWVSEIISLRRVIARRRFDPLSGNVTIELLRPESASQFIRNAHEFLASPLTEEIQIYLLARSSWIFSYSKPLQEGNALFKNWLFDTMGTFVKRGQKVTFDELLFLEPFKYHDWHEYAARFITTFVR